MSTSSPIPTTPGSTLDYTFDWTAWLPVGDSIASHTIGVVGCTLNSSASASGIVTAWVTLAATAAPGARSSITCTVTTAAGRVDSRKLDLVAEVR